MNCPQCNSQLKFVDQYQRHYCERCATWPGTGSAPAAPPAAAQAGVTQMACGPFTIDGKLIPLVTVNLGNGGVIRTQPGVMIYRDPTVQMQSKAHGGLMKGLGRAMLGGETVFPVEHLGPGRIAMSGGVPAEIMPVKLQGNAVRAKSGAFIACDAGVEMEVTTEKVGTAIIGGTGLFQLRFQGNGVVFIQAKGDIVSGTLGPGQSIVADENSFLACDDSVQRNRERVQGFRNILTGGEGLYLLKMNGPGRYWLESGGGFIDRLRQVSTK